MPALTTHFLFGDKVLEELPMELSSIIQKHRSLFNYGLQGPDLLFFRSGIPVKGFLPKMGSRMHREKVAETFAFLKQYIANHRENREDFPILLTYFLGYICHYYLDKTVHPYVYFLVESICNRHPEKKPYPVHVKIESEIDSILYELFQKEPVTKFSMKKHFTVSSEEKQIIAEMYSALLKEVFHKNFPPKEIAKAFDDLKNLNRMMYDPTGISVKLGDALESVFPRSRFLTAHSKPKQVAKDAADLAVNFNENCWHHPKDPSLRYRKSVLGLFNQAKEEVIPVLESTYDTLEDGLSVPFATDLNFAGNPVGE